MSNLNPDNSPNKQDKSHDGPFIPLDASFKKLTGLFTLNPRLDPSCHTEISCVAPDTQAMSEAEAVAKRFGLEPKNILEVDIHPFNSRGFVIETEKGDYFLKKNLGWKLRDNGELLRALDEVFIHLWQEGVRAPILFSGPDNPDPFIRHGRHTFMLFDHINADHRLEGKDREIISLARETAALHKSLKSFEVEHPHSLIARQINSGDLGVGYNEFVSEERLKTLLEHARTSPAFDPIKGLVMENAESILSAAKLVKKLLGPDPDKYLKPTQLIHSDLLAQNVLITGEGAVILDFEKLHRGPVYADIATAAFESARQAARFHGIEKARSARDLFLDTYHNENQSVPRSFPAVAAFALNRALQSIQVDLERHYLRNDWALDGLVKSHITAIDEAKHIFELD